MYRSQQRRSNLPVSIFVLFFLCLLFFCPVSAAETERSSADNIVYDQQMTTLLQCPTDFAGELVIPDGVTHIAENACKGCTGLTSVTFPSSIQVIESGAFQGCSKLKDFYFYCDMPQIGENTFSSVGTGRVKATAHYAPSAHWSWGEPVSNIIKKYALAGGIFYLDHTLEVKLDQWNFPDPTLLSLLSKERFDTDSSGTLSQAEIQNIRSLDADSRQISSFEGLAFLTALEELDLSYNKAIDHFDGSVAPSLKRLFCTYSSLTSVDLSSNTELLTFYAGSTNLTSLDLSSNLLLEDLVLDNCAYRIEANETGQFDLASLPGSFDESKASNWTGCYVSGTILTPAEGVTDVIYNYDCGGDFAATFQLHCCACILQEPKPAYLAQVATCKEPAKYYYSCSCGKISAETFPYGKTNTHSYVLSFRWDSYASVSATLNCELCGDTASHSCTISTMQEGNELHITASIEFGGIAYSDKKTIRADLTYGRLSLTSSMALPEDTQLVIAAYDHAGRMTDLQIAAYGNSSIEVTVTGASRKLFILNCTSWLPLTDCMILN